MLTDYAFVVLHDGSFLCVLTWNDSSRGPMPSRENILDWYAENYDFERSKLSGSYTHNVKVGDMKYEDFLGQTEKGADLSLCARLAEKAP